MTISNYFENLSEDRKKNIEDVRELIKMTYPDIEETMHYKMPTYVLNDEILCALASQKQYMALYIMPHDLLEDFRDELEKYDCGKSCIRFKKLENEDLELFERILQYTGKNYPKSEFYGKMNVNKK